LIKALMNMPSTDFLLAAYLISEKNVSIYYVIFGGINANI
jgi:hypothetical protein